ncbi:MAG: hypothetical protein L0Y72_19935 [Gemmataceae bacterium]|nr:hypothetical protein [Gemmataceae bacterium]MCI0741307.1 hypothetical protein [Gemmataceae bacterium]
MHEPKFIEGPFGLPLLDAQAKALATRLEQIPKDDAFLPRRLATPRGLSVLLADERSDISWITVETPDHLGDLVLADGMDDSIYRLNPIVTLNHSYTTPPVGRSVWRRVMRLRDPNSSPDVPLPHGRGSDGSAAGVKAKTVYPPRPEDWSGDWPADAAFQLVEAGLLRGKSIGFLPLHLHSPSDQERKKNPRLENVRFVITRWLLLEYACCYLPMQPLALVEEVKKALHAKQARTLALREPEHIPFLRVEDYERGLVRSIGSQGFQKKLLKSLLLAFQKRRGMV